MGRKDVQRPTRVTKPTPAQTPKQTPPTPPPKQTPPTPPQRPQRPQKPQHSRTAQVQHQNKQQVHPIQKAVTQSPIPQAHATTQSAQQTSPIQRGESLEGYHKRVDPLGYAVTKTFGGTSAHDQWVADTVPKVTGAATVGWKALETGVNLTPYGQAIGAIKTAQETPYSGQTQTDTRKNQNKIVLPDGAPYDPNVAYRFDGEGGYTTAPNPMAASPQQGGSVEPKKAEAYVRAQEKKRNQGGTRFSQNKKVNQERLQKEKLKAEKYQQKYQDHASPFREGEMGFGYDSAGAGQHKHFYNEKWLKGGGAGFNMGSERNQQEKSPEEMNIGLQGIWGRKGNIKGDTVKYKAPIYTMAAEQRKKEQENRQIKKAQDKYVFDFLNMEKKQRRKDKFFSHYLND